MKLTGIDHFVLTVEDVEATCAFYEDLGAEIVTFGDDRKALRFGEQKINLHPIDNDVDIVAREPTPGGGDCCLVTETPIEDVERRLRERDVEIVMGPVERTGAVGPITSVYVRDPDGNLIEIGRYDD
ncbi:Catechol 2,3-dioxygenase [Natronorubrum sediminis]|uniref:Catechol 2,3-dioxygenase n=1 Tax=Natronorubrum sediminis TaxID=640943 RepID=A0A1H6FYN8_9EURY|nr:VOC family protein [Natronorubrum sediminis]SEH15906.1 Catechol 2,3-dioxygenase [Natronorubrum sediminis]